MENVYYVQYAARIPSIGRRAVRPGDTRRPATWTSLLTHERELDLRALAKYPDVLVRSRDKNAPIGSRPGCDFACASGFCDCRVLTDDLR
jgi:arginyl-tRNA synthetase